jgi:predicted phage terminase large subunit-like protein
MIRLRDFIHGPRPCDGGASCTGAWHLVEPGTTFASGWHIDAICERLEAVSRGEIKKLIINVPPGSMKTLTTSVFWPCWQWAQTPSWKWLAASHDLALVRRDAQRVIDIVTSQWYQARWPQCQIRDSNSCGVERFTTTAQGERASASIGGGGQMGFHFNVKIIDDPLKPLDVASRTEVALNRVIDWYSSTVSMRNIDSKTKEVLIMQRVHERDLAGFLRERGFESLILPLEYCPTRHSVGDRRTVEGEPLWPARHTPEVIADLKTRLGTPSNVAAQLQQDPTPQKGGIIEREWFRRYDVLPSDGSPLQWFQAWDLADKGSDASHSRVSGTLWAHRPGELYLVDEVCELWTYPVTKREFAQRQGRRWDGSQAVVDAEAQRKYRLWCLAHTILVEEKASGIQLVQEMAQAFPGITPTVPKDSKADRLRMASAVIDGKQVWVPLTAWAELWLDEIVGFPRYGHDDRVDTLTSAVARFTGSSARLKSLLGSLSIR